MPLEIYSYKEGSRSTPKLRRNQSNWTYGKGNSSIDSFTSLRPDSPDDLCVDAMHSPASLTSPQQSVPSAWKTFNPSSPSTSVDPEKTGEKLGPAKHRCKRELLHENSYMLKSCPRIVNRAAFSSEALVALELDLQPCEVLVTSKMNEKGHSKLFDRDGNNITHRFNGLEAFEDLYEREKEVADTRREKFGHFLTKCSIKLFRRRVHTYVFEVWHRR